MKKMFLEIPQNSQENTYPKESFLIKLQASPFFTEHLWWLLLNKLICLTFSSLTTLIKLLDFLIGSLSIMYMVLLLWNYF